jgi:hypothetical protein
MSVRLRAVRAPRPSKDFIIRGGARVFIAREGGVANADIDILRRLLSTGDEPERLLK